MVERQSVIIQEQSNSNNSLLSYYTAAHEELGTRNNSINIDQLLDPSPLPPHTPVYTHPRTQSAPVTAPCPMCHRHGHTTTQCVWYGDGVCSYCEEVGHTVHNCNALHRDQQHFNPHLLYCLTIGTYLGYLWHSTILSLDVFQVWYPWELIGG